MSKNLVIVESPAKAKTISKYLGNDFAVLASYGHVRDLVPKGGAVDPEHDFAMKYQVIERNEKHVNAIIRALRKADALYLATDPDREGEAISWHLVELLKEKGALNGKPVHRIVFHEITKPAVQAAIDWAEDLEADVSLADALEQSGAAADVQASSLEHLLRTELSTEYGADADELTYTVEVTFPDLPLPSVTEQRTVTVE